MSRILVALVFLFGGINLHAGDLQGRKNLNSPKENLEKVIYSERNTVYEGADFAVPASTTAYNVAANQHIFTSTGVPVASHVSIRSDADLTLQFNSTGTTKIRVSADEFPFQMNWLEVTNIFIDSVAGANVQIEIY